jgi:hypothetical protein
MRYRYRNYRPSKPTPRNIQAKYAGDCVCCGARINAGEMVTYYPVGTIAGITKGEISHIGGLDGNSAKCSANIGKKLELADKSVNDYAGDGLDTRWEDDCASKCGL